MQHKYLIVETLKNISDKVIFFIKPFILSLKSVREDIWNLSQFLFKIFQPYSTQASIKKYRTYQNIKFKGYTESSIIEYFLPKCSGVNLEIPLIKCS